MNEYKFYKKKVNNIDKIEIYIIKNKVSQSYILFLLIFK